MMSRWSEMRLRGVRTVGKDCGNDETLLRRRCLYDKDCGDDETLCS